jgi:hypothetical protein
VKIKEMTKPENKPVPKMVRNWVPKIATNQVKSLAMDYKRSARREATRFVESRISYQENNPIPGSSSLFK